METMTEMTLRGFTAALGEKTPVPGGGGAAAMAAALGAALGGMVAAYGAESDGMRDIRDACEQLRGELLLCIDRDAEAFAPLARAYRIPRDDPARGETMERCLTAAAQPPLEMMRLCCRALALHEALLERCGAALVSDVGAGAALCRGALCAAAVNVRVNTRLLRARDAAGEIDREAEELLARGGELAGRIYDEVCGRLA